MYKSKKSLLLATFIGSIIVLTIFQCNQPEKVTAVHSSGLAFAGSETCVSCHGDLYKQHLEMAHFSTSSEVEINELREKLAKQHELVLSDSVSYKIMEEGGMVFQEGYFKDTLVGRQPFHITIGSGKRGQTFAYWNDSFLYQLPVSHYSSSHSWVNSPGYSTADVKFGRQIQPRCMECHSTYMTSLPDPMQGRKNKYDPKKMILGITCERCHGPAKKHVDFHLDNPDEKTASHILKYADMNRQQKLDGCALCHSGPRRSYTDPFTFLIGDTLAYHSMSTDHRNKPGELDVHANQYGLLTASKCFINSPEMDCSTCHDVHQKQVGDLAMFSTKCMNCHNQPNMVDCGLKEKVGVELETNCIDCHMPNLSTNSISIRNPISDSLHDIKIRTHYIGIYPENAEEVKAFMQSL